MVRPDRTIDTDALQRTLDDLAARLDAASTPRGLAPATVTAGSFDPTDRGLRAAPGAVHVSTDSAVRLYVKTGSADRDWARVQTSLVTSVDELDAGCTGVDLTLTGPLTVRSGLTGSAAYLSGSLHVDQGATFVGALTGSSAWLSGSLTVGQGTTLVGSLTGSSAYLSGSVTVAGASTLTGDVGIAGALTGSSATYSGELKVQGQFSVSGSLVGDKQSLSLIASVNNWAVGSSALFIRFTSSVGAVSITGIEAGYDGQVLILINADTADTITLVHQSASSTSTNRFLSSTGANVALGPGDAAFAWYDITTARWRLFPFVQ